MTEDDVKALAKEIIKSIANCDRYAWRSEFVAKRKIFVYRIRDGEVVGTYKTFNAAEEACVKFNAAEQEKSAMAVIQRRLDSEI